MSQINLLSHGHYSPIKMCLQHFKKYTGLTPLVAVHAQTCLPIDTAYNYIHLMSLSMM